MRFTGMLHVTAIDSHPTKRHMGVKKDNMNLCVAPHGNRMKNLVLKLGFKMNQNLAQIDSTLTS